MYSKDHIAVKRFYASFERRAQAGGSQHAGSSATVGYLPASGGSRRSVYRYRSRCHSRPKGIYHAGVARDQDRGRVWRFV